MASPFAPRVVWDGSVENAPAAAVFSAYAKLIESAATPTQGSAFWIQCATPSAGRCVWFIVVHPFVTGSTVLLAPALLYTQPTQRDHAPLHALAAQ